MAQAIASPQRKQEACDKRAWNLRTKDGTQEYRQDTAKDVFFMTMSSPNDVFPIDVMLSHQLRMLGGPPAHVELMLDIDANWPDDDQLLGDDAFSVLSELNVTLVCQNFTQRGTDEHDSLLKLLGPVPPRKLSDLYSSKHPDIQPKDKKMLGNTIGMLTFLERCTASTASYCVWLDPDIVLHRGTPEQPGWLDKAMDRLTKYGNSVAVMAPTPPREVHWGSCGSAEETSAQISQRYFTLKRDRLQKQLPLFPHECKPDCRGFEYEIFYFVDDESRAAFDNLIQKQGNGTIHSSFLRKLASPPAPWPRPMYRGEKMLHMACAQSAAGPWALHPPTKRKHMLKMLQSCTTNEDVQLPQFADEQSAMESSEIGVSLWPRVRAPLRKLLTMIDEKGTLGPLSEDGQNMADEGWTCSKAA